LSKPSLHILVMEGIFMDKLKKVWLDFFENTRNEESWWQRKKALHRKRNAEIVRIQGEGRMFETFTYANNTIYKYLLYLSFLIKQHGQFIIEEKVTPYQFQLVDGNIINHTELYPISNSDYDIPTITPQMIRNRKNERFSYDRLAAVKYAERWWNSYNPAYKKFAVDCTNYVSQCLFAGGAPMRGAPVREQGWWYKNNNWSYSWSVSHSMRWYLSGSTQGLQGKEVEKAEDLNPGDIICYDFQGDGRWDHTTFVVAKDQEGMPLVNAHTENSRNRYWSYEDSTAWTPNIKYKFFRISE